MRKIQNFKQFNENSQDISNLQLKIYVGSESSSLSVEHNLPFDNVNQFLSLVKDHVIEAVEGHNLPLKNIGINGWEKLNRTQLEKEELNIGMNKIKEFAKSL
jgi:hypothetical protein